MHIDIVADLICPWCYVGKRRLERALARRPDLAITRRWLPFQLNPEMPRAGMPRDAYLAAKFGGAGQAARSHAPAAAAGLAEGLEFAFDRIRQVPNTLSAHRLIRRAAAAGCADRIVEAVFRAYFVEAVDIGDIDALSGIAAAAGLDRAATRAYLAGAGGSEEIRAADRRARRLGIHAVPCYIFDSGCAITGAQEPEILLPLFDIAAAAGDSVVVEA